MLKNAADPLICGFSERLWERKLFKCIDVLQEIANLLGGKPGRTHTEADEYKNRVERISVSIKESLEEWLEDQADVLPRLLIDKAEREPYKRFDESKGPLNQIEIQRQDGTILDVAEVSPAVAALEPFRLFRVYCDGDDEKTRKHVLDLIHKITTEIGSRSHGND